MQDSVSDTVCGFSAIAGTVALGNSGTPRDVSVKFAVKRLGTMHIDTRWGQDKNRRGCFPSKWPRLPLILLFLLGAAVAAAELEPKRIVLATIAPPDNFYAKWAEAVYGKALLSLGYKLQMRRCSPTLCTQLASHGEVDGEVLRAYAYQRVAPNLVRVEESALPLTWAAFATDDSIEITSWQAARDSGLRIAFVKGLPYLEQRFNGVASGTRVSKVGHWSVGLNKLNRGEIDVFVGADEVAGSYRQRPVYGRIHRAGTIESMPLYSYLHKKHANLAEKLARTLGEMKAQGEIEYFFQKIHLADEEN